MSATWTSAQGIYSHSVKRSGTSTYLSGNQNCQTYYKIMYSNESINKHIICITIIFFLQVSGSFPNKFQQDTNILWRPACTRLIRMNVFQETSYSRDIASAAFTWTTRRPDRQLLATVRQLVLTVIFRRDTQWLQGSHGRLAVVHIPSACDTALWLGAGLTQSHDSDRTSCGSPAEPLAPRYPGRQWRVHTVASVKRTDEFIVLHLLCLNVTLGLLPCENKIYWQGLESECWVEYWGLREQKLQKAISGIRRGIYEIFSRLWCYAA
jgi:hypothetical protein